MNQILEKYQVKIGKISLKKISTKGKSFFDISKKHILKYKGKKSDIALNADQLLYGKK